MLIWIRCLSIDETSNTASGTKVWALTIMVGITIAIVSFFGSRLVNQVDEMDKALQATREVQASQTEIIKG
ncbi:hypothetical protein, partial [Enterobacter hormaechei]